MSKYSELANRLDDAPAVGKYESELLGSAAAALRELEAENRLYSESLANATQDIERLRGLCNWAAGRLLDYGDVVGHEHVLTALEGKG